MGMEIPGINPTGLHSDYKPVEKTRNKYSEHNAREIREVAKLPLDVDIKQKLENLEKIIIQFNRRFEFSVDDNINRIVVKVIDTETDKIIREIPSEEIQHLLAGLVEMMGLLVNETI